MASEQTTLADSLGVCGWCPYKDITSREIDPDNLDEITAYRDEIQHEECTSVKDGQCKIARYAIENLVENN